MEKIERSAERKAFERYLRTGRSVQLVTVEHKFNPYHDPNNGQFTFAPGGPRSISNVIFSDRRGLFRSRPSNRALTPHGNGAADLSTSPNEAPAALRLAQYRPVGRRGIGGNGGPSIYDPMTLAQTFPGLASAPAGSIFTLADNALGITAPGAELTQDLTQAFRRKLIADTKAIDADYQPRDQLPATPVTEVGQAAVINELRFDRATAYYKVRGEERPIQLEVLRTMQILADQGYDEAVQRYDSGRLTVKLSREEAIGNYVDRYVRTRLKLNFQRRGIDTSKGQLVRVIGREYDSSGSDLTFRIPDARVGKIAFDVTLTAKTSKSAQIRGFFSSDFRPDRVIIIRPTQLGNDSSYAIIRAGK